MISGLIGCAGARPPAVAVGPSVAPLPALPGRWQLVAYEDWDSDGRRTIPYGKAPHGYIQYDTDSTMSVQIMRSPPLPAFARGEDHGTVEEKAAAFDGYVAYFGRWALKGPGLIVHHVEAGLDPTYVGTDQVRPFRVAGDSLILGDERTWRRVFVRVR